MNTTDEQPPSDTTATSPPDASPGPARLTRSPDDKVIAGVAGGLGRYFGVDPVLLRIAFVILAVAGGSGLLLYLIGWLVIPMGEPGEGAAGPVRPQSTAVVGIVLLVVGGILLLERLANPWERRGVFFALPLLPLALVGVGLWLLLNQRGAGGEPRPAPGPGSPPPPGPAAASFATPPAGSAIPPPPSTAAAPPGSTPPEQPRARSALGRLVLSVLLILAGLAALLDTSGAASISLHGFLAVGLVVTGLGLVVGTWWGRSRGLIGLGIALTLVLAASSAADITFGAGVGERLVRPASAAELESSYRLTVGDLTVDLRGVQLPPGTTELEIRVGAGELTVHVPANADVVVRARVGAGETDLFGRTSSGLGVREVVTDRPTAGDGDAPAPELSLSVRAGAGKVVVRRG